MSMQGRAHEEAGTRVWMTYVDKELRELCQEKGWRPPQVRRKGAVREKPVSSSGIDDYEWKLIPFEKTDEMEHDPADDAWGTYFVLGFDSTQGKFALQHDNHYEGMFGDHWVTSTFTEIELAKAWLLRDVSRLICARQGIEWKDLMGLDPEHVARWWVELPPPGLLRRILSSLTAQFKPNTFSRT